MRAQFAVHVQCLKCHHVGISCAQHRVASCLTELDRISGMPENPDEVELALWFHDAIFDRLICRVR